MKVSPIFASYMYQQKMSVRLFISLVCWVLIISCNNAKAPGDKKIVADPEQMDNETGKSIRQALGYGMEHDGKIDDSIRLSLIPLVNNFYTKNEYARLWSHKENWDPLADSLLDFVRKAELYGLFPADYHFGHLSSLKAALDSDSLKRMDAELWARAEVLFTDGFMRLVRDMKIGRLSADSTFLKKLDTPEKMDFYASALQGIAASRQLSGFIATLEPKLQGYHQLKGALPRFLDSMDRKVYTYVPFPFKPNNAKDSLFVMRKLQVRLHESGCIDAGTALPDSAGLIAAIKKYQQKKAVKQDGKVTASLVRLMNLTDPERFRRIAINLDRYKLLPDVMPEKYILVNLPAYYLKVWENDSVALESRIICGRPNTRTPLLNSVISDMITYPTWTVPTSIIAKQYLPKLKVNPYYLSTIGLKLVKENGEPVNPGDINWHKYNKGIPFKVVQASGDDNALGILKFNFKNPYSVYLHDTNQRYLFKNASRALSHGCVRVQQWDKLAYYIARNDSMNVKPGDTLRYTIDSLKSWLTNKERRRYVVKKGIPLFIAYFSCEEKSGKIRFYEDIYGEDKMMRERYFSGK